MSIEYVIQKKVVKMIHSHLTAAQCEAIRMLVMSIVRVIKRKLLEWSTLITGCSNRAIICEAGRPNQCHVGHFRHVFFYIIGKGSYSALQSAKN